MADTLIRLALWLVMIGFVGWMVYRYYARRRAAPTVDYAALDLPGLRDLSERLTAALEREQEIETLMREVKISGGDAERLRQIVSGVWEEIEDKSAAAWLFDGEDDQRDWLKLLRGKLARSLPPVLSVTGEIAQWHGQNRYKTELCPVGEGGMLRPIRRVTRRDWDWYNGKCPYCGEEIDIRLATKKGEKPAVKTGLTYGGTEYVFCDSMCRSEWLDSGKGGRDFAGEVLIWHEWYRRDDENLPVVREELHCYR